MKLISSILLYHQTQALKCTVNTETHPTLKTKDDGPNMWIKLYDGDEDLGEAFEFERDGNFGAENLTFQGDFEATQVFTSAKVKLEGTRGTVFTKLEITCENGASADFIEEFGCDSDGAPTHIWFDKRLEADINWALKNDVKCWTETADTQKKANMVFPGQPVNGPTQNCQLNAKVGQLEASTAARSMVLTFFKNDEIVQNKFIMAEGRYDQVGNSFTEDFGAQPEWDTVQFELDTNNGTNMEIFEIVCDNGQSLDLVELGGCTGSLWFDNPRESDLEWGRKNDPCYEPTASNVKQATLAVWTNDGVKTALECSNSDIGDSNNDGQMTCAEGEQIEVQSAAVGRADSGVCNAQWGYNLYKAYLPCDNSFDVTGTIKEQCDGQTTCKYQIMNGANYFANMDGYEDPCHAKHKYNEIKYKCVPEPKADTCVTLYNKEQTASDFADAQSVDIPAGDYENLFDFEYLRGPITKPKRRPRKAGWKNKARYAKIQPNCKLTAFKRENFEWDLGKFESEHTFVKRRLMQSMKCECFGDTPTCKDTYGKIPNGCLAPTCDVANNKILDAWKAKEGDKLRYGFAMKISVPEEYWGEDGWSVLLRFNGAHVNSGSFQLWNAKFHNFFRKDSGLEVLIHQKFWTAYDLHDRHSFVIVAERLLGGDLPEVYFWNNRQTSHHCFDQNMHSSGTRGLGTEFEQAVDAKESVKSTEDVSIVKISTGGKVRVQK